MYQIGFDPVSKLRLAIMSSWNAAGNVSLGSFESIPTMARLLSGGHKGRQSIISQCVISLFDIGERGGEAEK